MSGISHDQRENADFVNGACLCACCDDVAVLRMPSKAAPNLARKHQITVRAENANYREQTSNRMNVSNLELNFDSECVCVQCIVTNTLSINSTRANYLSDEIKSMIHAMYAL